MMVNVPELFNVSANFPQGLRGGEKQRCCDGVYYTTRLRLFVIRSFRAVKALFGLVFASGLEFESQTVALSLLFCNVDPSVLRA